MTPDRCPWYLAGPLLGLVIVGLRATLNKPLGALGGYVNLTENATTPLRLGFPAFVLAGVVLGGAAFAAMHGSVHPTLVYGTAGGLLPESPITQVVIVLLAGIAMGFGARTAGGCTSGHGMSGVSLGSPASLVATMTFFGTAVAVAHLLAAGTGAGP